MALIEVSSSKCFEGYQKVFQHDSVSTKCPMRFGVYLPPCYSHDEPCHVVFFLSGLNCTEEDFITRSGAQRYASKLGLILVNPDTSPRDCNVPSKDDSFDFGTGASFYINATREPWKQNYQMYDYVTKELPGLMEKNFNIISGNICHPSVTLRGINGFTACLGSDADWSMYDTVELLRKHGKRFTIPPLIDQGDADMFIEKDLMPNELAKACAEVGQEINLRYQKGYDHFYFFISTFIEDHLKFHLDNLSKL
ncbi:hypothetical protein Aperf_G00000009776 [Anoplocephala perfoliata]